MVSPSEYEKFKKHQQTLGSEAGDCTLKAATPELQNNYDNTFMHPNVKAVQELDRDMKTILASTSMSDNEKVARYNEKLALYLNNFKTALEVPKKEAIIGKSAAPPLLPTENDVPISAATNHGFQSILDSIAKSYRPKATKLLNYLQQTPTGIQALPTGEIALDGTTIPRSNISKLLTAAVKNVPLGNADLPGYKEFLENVKPTIALSKRSTKKSTGIKPDTKVFAQKRPAPHSQRKSAPIRKKLRWESH